MTLRRLLCLSLLFSSALAPLPAEDRGLAVVPVTPDEKPLIGKNWMLLIGVNRYQEWPPLRGPVHDVKSLKKVLLEKYWFESEHVLELYDDKATKRNIRKALNDLMDGLQAEDTLLIYYAGHGQLAKNKVGYWIPYDGGTDEVEQRNWISSADLKGYMVTFKCRHVFLMADSCFSGDLLDVDRGAPEDITIEYYRKAFARMSRQVLTSGALEPVPDTGIEDHSEFAFHLIRELDAYPDSYLDPLKLFANIRTGVTKTLPLMGSLKDAGHQKGGTYIFFRRPTPSSDHLVKLLEEARKAEFQATDGKMLQEAGEKYQDYLRAATADKFPKEVAEAKEAKARLEQTLNGIASIREGSYVEAVAALEAATERYDTIQDSPARRQILNWRRCIEILKMIELGKLDAAAELVLAAAKETRPETSEEALKYSLRLGSLVEAWKVLDEASKPSDLLIYLRDKPRATELQQSVKRLSMPDEDFPKAVREISTKKNHTFGELARQESLKWFEQAEKLERQGRFDAEAGAARFYRFALDAAKLRETCGLVEETENLRKKAISGLVHSEESEKLLAVKSIQSLLPLAQKWVGKEGESAAAKYWNSMIPVYQKFLAAVESQANAGDVKAWTDSRDELVKIEQEIRNSERMVVFHPDLSENSAAIRQRLEEGLSVCQQLETFNVATAGDAGKAKQELEGILGKFPPELGQGPLRQTMLNLRKKILEEAEKREFGPSTQDAFIAVELYGSLPEKRSFESAEAEQLIAQAKKSLERVRSSLKLAQKVLESSGNEGLTLLESQRTEVYPDKMPLWLVKIEKNVKMHPKLIDEGTEILKVSFQKNKPEILTSLKNIRERLKCGQCHNTWPRTWNDYQSMRIGRLWRDVQLAYKFSLYRKFEAAEGEYLFRSEHDELEFPMVWVENEPEMKSPGFFIDKHEVAVGQFGVFWKQKREGQPGFRTWSSQLEEVKQYLEKLDDPGLQFPDHWPVVLATYQDAADFAGWSNLSGPAAAEAMKTLRRLPMEKEWRRAAYGSSGNTEERLYPWGNESKKFQCNVSGKTPAGELIDPWAGLVPTVLFENDDRSAWGCLGMGGNVSEWATLRPGGALQVILGSNFEDSLDRASSAFPRSTQPIDTRKGSTGFRCILELPADWDLLE